MKAITRAEWSPASLPVSDICARAQGYAVPRWRMSGKRASQEQLQEAIRTLVEMITDSLPDGDRHMLRIKVRSEGGDLVLQAAISFEVEAERRSTRGSPDSHV